MMNGQIKLQKLLLQKLIEMRAVNPAFSIRALAKKIKLQPSATNEIIKGERRVSRKIVEKISDNLLLNPTQRADLLQYFPEKMKRASKHTHRDINVNEKDYCKLTAQQFMLISDAIHFAILSLIKTDNFRSDIQWMANRLNSSPMKITAALKTLKSLNLITRNLNGSIIRSAAPITTDDDVLNLSLQKSHLQDMEIAKNKLLEIDIKKRDFTSITLPVEPELLPKAKEILRNAQLQLEELMEQGQQKEVYKLSMYFYPLTNLE